MQYFTPELIEVANEWVRGDWRKANREFELRCVRYRKQLQAIESRVSKTAWKVISQLNTHDATLLSIQAGDFVSGTPAETVPAFLVNRRRTSVSLRFADQAGDVYRLTYRGIRELTLNFSETHRWMGSGQKSFGDWYVDEWALAGKKHLSHEVLFASGAGFRIVFEHVTAVRRPRTGPRRAVKAPKGSKSLTKSSIDT